MNFTYLGQCEPMNFGIVESSIIIALSYGEVTIHVHFIAYEKLNTKFHWIVILQSWVLIPYKKWTDPIGSIFMAFSYPMNMHSMVLP